MSNITTIHEGPTRKTVAVSVVEKLWEDRELILLQLGATEKAIETAIDLARHEGATWAQINIAAKKNRGWIETWVSRRKVTSDEPS